MTPEEEKEHFKKLREELHNSIFVCIGNGTKGSECGHIGPGYNNAVCPKCGGMQLTEKGIREAESLDLIDIWKDF